MAHECRIKETPSSGNIVYGMKENMWVQWRLNRAFWNAKWFRLFPQKHLQYLERLGSDNRPIFISMKKCKHRRVGRFDSHPESLIMKSREVYHLDVRNYLNGREEQFKTLKNRLTCSEGNLKEKNRRDHMIYDLFLR
ncbi:hypothetical protein YC2023_010678 [Brassica napus]